jgi:hypothetical protein
VQHLRVVEKLSADVELADERLSSAVERRVELDDNLRSLQRAHGGDALRKQLAARLADAIKAAEQASLASNKLHRDLDAERALVSERLATVDLAK